VNLNVGKGDGPICVRNGGTRLEGPMLENERLLRVVPRRKKDVESSRARGLEAPLKDIAAPIHMFVILTFVS